MKKLLIIIIFSGLLFGCENEQKNDEEAINDQSFQEQIQNVMKDNDAGYQSIIDFDIKDNYLIAVYIKQNHGLDAAILKKENNELKWVIGDTSSFSFSAKDSPVVTILDADDANMKGVKDVKVLGKPTKAVTYKNKLTDDFTQEYKYWIAYTDKKVTLEDIEFIKE